MSLILLFLRKILPFEVNFLKSSFTSIKYSELALKDEAYKHFFSQNELFSIYTISLIPIEGV